MSYGDKHKTSTNIGTYDDAKYDAHRDALDKFYRNPEKYSTHHRSSPRSNGDTEYRRPDRVTVVIEHW